jgi:hypothetical protein
MRFFLERLTAIFLLVIFELSEVDGACPAGYTRLDGEFLWDPVELVAWYERE